MRILLGVLFILLLIFQISIFLFDFPLFHPTYPPLKVGLVYSKTGFRAKKEENSLQAALMAIQEINDKGGLLGRQIHPLVRDAQSNWNTTQAQIESLILEEKVDVIFGGWTKGNRYTIKKLFEKHQHLLINPFHYDGIVNSPHLIWIGTTLNQQVSPTVKYCLEHFGKRFFLVGSDYILPYIINIFAKDQINIAEGEVVGERYIPLNSYDIDPVIQAIVETKPQVILSALIGQENADFFKKLRQAGITPEKIPVFSFSLSEVVLQDMNIEDAVGNYATWNYFESINTPLNHQFVSNFLNFSGLKVVDNTAEASYLGVVLWAQAVQEAGTTNIKTLSYIFNSMHIDAPEGPISMDVEGRNAWKYSRIGKVRSDGQFDIIWQSKLPIRPTPFHLYRSQSEWEELTEELYLEPSHSHPHS